MKLALTLVAFVLCLSSCTERVLPPGGGPQSVRFELVYPAPPAGANYYAVSGVRLVTDEILTDTLTLVTGRTFFAQFFAGPGIALPTQVELNGSPFVRHLETDTLRLASTGSTTLFGPQIWKLTDAAGQSTFQSAAVQEIDSVAPLMFNEPMRGDTALTLTWRAPTAGSNGLLLTWRAPGVETHSQLISDIGRFTIPAAVVARFSGESELILTRFRTDTETYNERQLFVTRITQRNYKVMILG